MMCAAARGDPESASRGDGQIWGASRAAALALRPEPPGVSRLIAPKVALSEWRASYAVSRCLSVRAELDRSPNTQWTGWGLPRRQTDARVGTEMRKPIRGKAK